MKSLLISLLLTACATTPQGKSIDRANKADLASTGLALTLVEGATEANPLGLALLPLKIGMGRWIDTFECAERAEVAGIINPMYYGAAANNLAIAVGVSGIAAPIVGIIAGVIYANKKGEIEQATYDCIPAGYELTELPCLLNNLPAGATAASCIEGRLAFK